MRKIFFSGIAFILFKYSFAFGFMSQQDIKNLHLLKSWSEGTGLSISQNLMSNVQLPEYGLYIYALYSGDVMCTNDAPKNSFFNNTNTSLITTAVPTSTKVLFGENMLYNVVWNALASANTTNITPGKINHVIAALITTAPGNNNFNKTNKIVSCNNCGLDAVFSNATPIHDDYNNKCLNISCNDTNLTCNITTPNLEINNYLPFPGGNWSTVCDTNKSTYDGKTLKTYCKICKTWKRRQRGNSIYCTETKWGQNFSMPVTPGGNCNKSLWPYITGSSAFLCQ